MRSPEILNLFCTCVKREKSGKRKARNGFYFFFLTTVQKTKGILTCEKGSECADVVFLTPSTETVLTGRHWSFISRTDEYMNIMY